MDQELAAAAAEDGLTLIQVTALGRDEGTIVVLHGFDADDNTVTFACEPRMAQDIVDALEEGTEVLTAVEPWAILSAYPSPEDHGPDFDYTEPDPEREGQDRYIADLDGTSGQDRESYTDDQDRDEYTVDDDYERRADK